MSDQIVFFEVALGWQLLETEGWMKNESTALSNLLLQASWQAKLPHSSTGVQWDIRRIDQQGEYHLVLGTCIEKEVVTSENISEITS